MIDRIAHALLACAILCAAVGAQQESADNNRLIFEGEKHFGRVTQLTFGAENAEAYFSFGGDRLIFQSTRGGRSCDQIYTMNLDGSNVQLMSTGQGKTTCAYFMPGDTRVLFSSTHHLGADCPQRPDFKGGYAWPLDGYDIYTAKADGTDIQPLITGDKYDAEATVSPKGDRIVFTSDRDGDLEVYSCAIDGSDIRRLTDHVGYDGGPFFSPDGSKIVYRAQNMESKEQEARYKDLLSRRLVEPTALDIWVMDADGRNKVRVVANGAANFCPFFHPSGKKIIFASNMNDPKGRNFDLFIVNIDGTGLEQVTFSPTFDGFPMFSPDGKYLVFGSNRNNAAPRDTNIFLVEWID